MKKILFALLYVINGYSTQQINIEKFVSIGDKYAEKILLIINEKEKKSSYSLCEEYIYKDINSLTYESLFFTDLLKKLNNSELNKKVIEKCYLKVEKEREKTIEYLYSQDLLTKW